MKQNRLHTCVIAYFLAVCLLAGVFFACAPIRAQASDAYTLSDQITEVIERVEALERATEKHYKTKNTFDYTTRYIRSGAYSDIRWQMLVGTIDSAYEKAMRSYADLRKIRNLLVMTDRFGNRYCVDFVHMAAVADAKRDFAGWAGDLITLAADISSLYEARLLLASELGTFGSHDLRADIDALNLCALAKENGGSLSRAMRSYYLEGGIRTAVATFLWRETGLSDEEMSVESVYAAFAARLSGDACEEETLTLEKVYGVDGTDRLDYACLAFAEWLYRAYCDEMSGHEEIVLFVYPPTCVQEGYTCVVCRHCGRMERKDKAPALQHQWNEITFEPTETEPGCIKNTCMTCGYSISTLFDVLQTGDMDLDGKLTTHDYMRLKRGILGSSTLTERQRFLADVNQDDLLDEQDYLLLRVFLLHGAILTETDVE